MIREPAAQPPQDEVPDAGVHQGHGRSSIMDERLKRLVKQHPRRDEPRVDSVEPDETPAARPVIRGPVPK